MGNLHDLAELLYDINDFYDLSLDDLSTAKDNIYELLKYEVKRSFKSILRNVLMRNVEVRNYPPLLDHFIRVISSHIDDQFDFFNLIDLDYYENKFTVKRVSLESLGNYQDFISGKVAAGGNEESTVKSINGWRFFYMLFIRGEDKQDRDRDKLYPKIMQRRFDFWESKYPKQAPMWYWFSRSVGAGADGTPMQQTVGLESELTSAAKRIVARFNDRFVDYTRSYRIYDYVDDYIDSVVNNKPEPEIEKYKVHKGKYDLETIKQNLRSGKWELSKVYVREIGNRVVTLAHVFNAETGGFTGAQVEVINQQQDDWVI